MKNILFTLLLVLSAIGTQAQYLTNGQIYIEKKDSLYKITNCQNLKIMDTKYSSDAVAILLYSLDSTKNQWIGSEDNNLWDIWVDINFGYVLWNEYETVIFSSYPKMKKYISPILEEWLTKNYTWIPSK